MFRGIMELVFGIVLVLFLGGFIAAANTDNLGTTGAMLLGFVPLLALISIIWGSFDLFMSRKHGG